MRNATRGIRRSLLLAVTCALAPVVTLAQDSPPDVRPYFNTAAPDQPTIEQALLAYITNAQRSIRVQANTFTNDKVGTALINARQRGLTVEVIINRPNANARGNDVARLVAGKVSVWLDPMAFLQRAPHDVANEKVIIIDDEFTMIGSYDLTAGANDNAESVVVIKHKPTAATFTNNFTAHRLHSDPAP